MDGSCMANRTTDAHTGIGVWFSPNNPNNRAEPVSKNLIQSNTTAELLAIYKALIHMPSQANLHIKTDSEWDIKALGENSTRHSDENFTNISHNIIRPTINKMRKQAGTTTFEWLKGHSRIEGNEGADKLAKEGSAQASTWKTLFITSPKHNHIGTHLMHMTQANAYKLIIKGQKQRKPSCRATLTNLNLT